MGVVAGADGQTNQPTGIWIHGGFAQLHGVHFSLIPLINKIITEKCNQNKN